MRPIVTDKILVTYETAVTVVYDETTCSAR